MSFNFFFLTHAVIPSWEKWTRILDQEFFASSPFDPHNSLWNYNLKKILQAAAPGLSEMCCLSRSLKLESTLLCFKKAHFQCVHLLCKSFFSDVEFRCEIRKGDTLIGCVAKRTCQARVSWKTRHNNTLVNKNMGHKLINYMRHHKLRAASPLRVLGENSD